MNSDKAFVSTSENGVGPAKISLHGNHDEPDSECNRLALERIQQIKIAKANMRVGSTCVMIFEVPIRIYTGAKAIV